MHTVPASHSLHEVKGVTEMGLYIYTFVSLTFSLSLYVYMLTVPASHSLHAVKGVTEVVRAAQRPQAARPSNG